MSSKKSKPVQMIDKIERWIDHIRAHGVTDEQVHEALLGLEIPEFLRLLSRDVNWLAVLARLRPGSTPGWVMYEIEQLAEAGYCEFRLPEVPKRRRLGRTRQAQA